MDDDPRARIRGWVNLMRKYGIEPPPETRQAALPRAALGSFGGWAAQPTAPAPAPTPQTPVAPPRMPSSFRDQSRVAPQRPAAPTRTFPVRNAPWGDS